MRIRKLGLFFPVCGKGTVTLYETRKGSTLTCSVFMSFHKGPQHSSSPKYLCVASCVHLFKVSLQQINGRHSYDYFRKSNQRCASK